MGSAKNKLTFARDVRAEPRGRYVHSQTLGPGETSHREPVFAPVLDLGPDVERFLIRKRIVERVVDGPRRIAKHCGDNVVS